MSKYMVALLGPKDVPAIVLKDGEEGVIKHIQYSKGGDWLTTERGSSPLGQRFASQFGSDKNSLGRLTEEEFMKVRDSIPGIPGDELEECYKIAKDQAKWGVPGTLAGLYHLEH